MVSQYNKQKSHSPPEINQRLMKAQQPSPFGNPVKPVSFGLKILTQAGNIGGLHIEEEDKDFADVKLAKTT
tara:strand:- start:355 stop:567 length:213 start_codon:yes stop_codon:yes gene_type:complete